MEPQIFRSLRQQMLWPSIDAAVDVYQRRRASRADHYELIWRLIHICECLIITLAAAAISRLREMGNKEDYLRVRERCYGVSWNSAEGTLQRGLGALDGSMDKWVEILHHITSSSTEGSTFLSNLRTFLGEDGPISAENGVDLGPLVRAWSRACEVPPHVTSDVNSVKNALLAVNVFRNRFAHVPFPYDQLEEVYKGLESCVFKIFEIKPSACNEESPLSGTFASGDSFQRGGRSQKVPDDWQTVPVETFVWGKSPHRECWDGQPFILLDKMLRPYLLTRLKHDAGSWEYIRYLAEANAVYPLSAPDLIKKLPRPTESDYPQSKEETTLADSGETPLVASHSGSFQSSIAQATSRSEAIAATRERNFPSAIAFWRAETIAKPYYHSGWQRLGFAQREFGVDLMDSERDRAERLFNESIESFTKATSHTDPQFASEAYYNRSKAQWRLWRLTGEQQHFDRAVEDANMALTKYYDKTFQSWAEFLQGNAP